MINITNKRNVFYSKKYNFLYFFTPRTGSTSISKWFSYIHGNKDIKSANQKTISKYNILHTEPIDYSKVFKFISVRDPYTRFLSAFLFIRRPPGSGGNNIMKRAFDVTNTNIHKDSINEFLNKAIKNKEKFLNFDHHFKRQSDMFNIKIGFYDKIVRLETIEKDITNICKKLNIEDWFLPKSNVTKTTNNKTDNDVTNIPISEITKTGVPSYDSFLTDSIKEKIYRLYTKDFNYLNYDK